MSGGLTAIGHASSLLHYGPNDIDVPVKPYHALFIDEVLHPFYIFQVGQCLLRVKAKYRIFLSLHEMTLYVSHSFSWQMIISYNTILSLYLFI